MKKYIGAISGGPDSMAMLNMYKKKISVVCSVDYQKRENSHKDNEKVEIFCKENNIEYFLLKVDEKKYKEINSNNFQDIARKIRYNFFIEISNKVHINNLMVAHNLDDYVETAKMQFNRNSKSLYYGIKYKNVYESLNIYRPLIKFRKKTLERYCVKKKIPYSIDSSNLLNIYERNSIRNEISQWTTDQMYDFLLKIKKYNNKNKKKQKLVNKYFGNWTESDFSYIFFKNINDEEIKYHIIYKFLLKNKEVNFSYQKIINILEFLKKNNNKKYRLENNKFIFIKNNKVILI